MTSTTGEGTCQRCQGKVLLVRNVETGQIVRLDPQQRDDGRWEVTYDRVAAVQVAKYDPEHTGGYRGHDMPCLQGEIPTGRRRLVLGTYQEARS